MISFSTGKLRKNRFGPLRSYFLFQLLKLRKIHVKNSETNWWKHLMNSLYITVTSHHHLSIEESKRNVSLPEVGHWGPQDFFDKQILVSWYMSKLTMPSTRPALNFAMIRIFFLENIESCNLECSVHFFRGPWWIRRCHLIKPLLSGKQNKYAIKTTNPILSKKMGLDY